MVEVRQRTMRRCHEQEGRCAGFYAPVRDAAERVIDVESLLGQLGEIRETSHGSLEITIGEHLSFLGGPRHRELTEQHVVDLRKILRSAGITPNDVEGNGALHS